MRVTLWGLGLAVLLLVGNGVFVIARAASDPLDVAWIARTCGGPDEKASGFVVRSMQLDHRFGATEFRACDVAGSAIYALRPTLTKALCVAGVGCLLPPTVLAGCP